MRGLFVLQGPSSWQLPRPRCFRAGCGSSAPSDVGKDLSLCFVMSKLDRNVLGVLLKKLAELNPKLVHQEAYLDKILWEIYVTWL